MNPITVNMILTDKYCQDLDHYGIDGQEFQIPFEKVFPPGSIIGCGHPDLDPLIVDLETKVKFIDEGNGLKYWLHTVRLFNNNPNRFYPRIYLVPGTLYTTIPSVDDSRPFFSSLIDAMKPHQILFNRRMAGEKLTDEENKILDADFPVQKAYDELKKNSIETRTYSITAEASWLDSFEKIFEDTLKK